MHQSNYDGTAGEHINVVQSSFLNTYDQSISPELGEGEEDAEVPQSIEKQRYEDFVKKFKDDLAEQRQQEQEQQQPQPPSRPVSQQFPESIALPAPDMDSTWLPNCQQEIPEIGRAAGEEIALLHKNGLSEQARMIQSRKEDLIRLSCATQTPPMPRSSNHSARSFRRKCGEAKAILTLNGEVARVSLSESIDGKAVSNDNMARIGAEIEKACLYVAAVCAATATPVVAVAVVALRGDRPPQSARVESPPERNLELQSDWAATAPGRCPGSHLPLGSGNRFTPKANVSPGDITRFIVVSTRRRCTASNCAPSERPLTESVSTTCRFR